MSALRADYPGKKKLSRSDQVGVLRSGPELKWFEPWAERGVLMPDHSIHPLHSRYGYVHITYGDPASPFLRYDVNLFRTREGLAWALEALHKDRPRCGADCHGVLYFTPDEPLRLRLVVEAPDRDVEAAE